MQDKVPVEKLDQPKLHNCNAEGLDIVVPDDWGTKQVQAIGISGAMSRSDRSGKFRMVNWEIEGVGVSFGDGDSRHLWGTTEAPRQRLSVITP